MRKTTRGLIALPLIMLGLSSLSAAVLAQAQPSIRPTIQQAFASVSDAEKAGGNVTSLVSSLNRAVALSSAATRVQSSNPERALELSSQADSIAAQVISDAANVRETAIANQRVATEVYLVEMLVLGAIGAIVYGYGPRVLWRLWYTLHSDWSLKP